MRRVDFLLKTGNAVAGFEGDRMVAPQHLLLVGQQFPQQPQRVACLARLPGPVRDVVAVCERAGILRESNSHLNLGKFSSQLQQRRKWRPFQRF